MKEASRLCHVKGQSASGRVESSYVPWDTSESQCLIRALLVKDPDHDGARFFSAGAILSIFSDTS